MEMCGILMCCTDLLKLINSMYASLFSSWKHFVLCVEYPLCIIQSWIKSANDIHIPCIRYHFPQRGNILDVWKNSANEIYTFHVVSIVYSTSKHFKCQRISRIPHFHLRLALHAVYSPTAPSSAAEIIPLSQNTPEGDFLTILLQ